MPLRYDLHTHSTASDGTLTPAQLVDRAAAAGVDVLALTDHDTTAGVREAEQEAERRGMALVAGVEISVSWGPQVIHLVGLGVDPLNEPLQAGLAGLRRFREWRAQEIGRRLQKKGIPGAYEGAAALCRGQLVSRTHFARFLVEQGHAGDVRQVFQHFLVRGKPGYVPGEWAPLEQAVGWILDAGGQAVVAHPARYPLNRGRLRRLLGEFREAGGSALEVISGSHSRDDAFTMARHARDFGLHASAGSDYHGPENPWIELGRLPPLPEGVRPIWHDWPEQRVRNAV
ncbi:MAG TPA: PHP domain-containing protein [Sedimenticola thiotaurini]|uniref:PHP domain-containing protein n=1 Tax=Sedimenticola thiotaurini TaxID=1543721 RepID=A0A831W7U9_9GAMM|nr:PHP domain-containing protein [Sedimenticola thiotaurini]